MAPTLFEQVEIKSPWSNIYREVKKYAKTLLGGIHHICTNDFRTPSGAVIWTAHGVRHSEALENRLAELIQLPSIKEANVTVAEICALRCAAWLHDVGMFIRHPDYPDLNVQRKYHGRLARTMLANMKNHPVVPAELSNQIAEICELHQAKTGKIMVPSDRTTLLGNLLLMADSLDIGQHRTSEAEEGGAVLNMIRSTTTLSETSAIEWWVNDCISNTEVSVTDHNAIDVTVTVEHEQLKKWKKQATHNRSTLKEGDELTLLAHLNDILNRYLMKEHIEAIRARGGKWKDIIDITQINLKLRKEGQVQVVSNLPTSEIRSYRKARQLWAEQLSSYGLNSMIRIKLNEIKSSVRADAVYLFVFDGLSDTIKYLHNRDFKEINNMGDDYEYIMRKQRIQRKCGIIGHVAFCGLVTAVEDLEQDPRRCFEREDYELGLHSVMFYPLIRNENFLWGVVMVNRKKHSKAGSTFRAANITDFRSVMNSYEEQIIAALEEYAKPYLD